jgi:hypothetical protein
MSKEPLRGPSVPGDQVQGPEDLVMRPNVATSDDWDQIPLPARQQLGWKERYQGESDTQGAELKDYVDESPENLVHSTKLALEEGLGLSQSVTYHLEATPPPAEPAGAPGSDGYNRINRGVEPAEGFDFPADYTIEQGAGVRTFRLPEGVGLSEEEQAKVDGTGPHAPAKSRLGDPKNLSDDTRERENLSAAKLDPHRNQAIEAEQSKDKPRQGLLTQLNEKL